ncbi:hypothetical protein JCM8097_005087 [Rhodosporidiobolus ruineniae]
MPPARDAAWTHYDYLDLEKDGKELTAGGITVKKAFNSSHDNAWCKPEVKEKMAELKDAEDTSFNTEYDVPEVERKRARRVKALKLVIPIRGQLDRLNTHILVCSYASEVEKRAARKRAEGRGKTVAGNGAATNLDSDSDDDDDASNAPRQTTLMLRTTNKISAEKQDEFDELPHLPRRYRFLPLNYAGANLPSRKHVGGKVMRRVVGRIEDSDAKKVKGKLATYTCDGWNDCQRRHLVVHLIIVDGIAYIVGVEDITDKAKTGALALEGIEKYAKKAEETYGVKIAAVCTDSGSDCASARRQYLVKNPHVIVVPCYAHQLQLVIGDVFKQSEVLAKADKLVQTFVVWARSHSRVIGLLNRFRKEAGQPPLVFVLPGTTRWTSNLAAAKRLLELKESLLALRMAKKKELLTCAGETPAAKKKASAMVDLLGMEWFWEGVETIVSTLEPLAVATNIAQANSCGLDDLFLLFGRLYHQYADIVRNGDPLASSAAASALASLDARFLVLDQDTALVAALLNVFWGQARLGLSDVVEERAGGLYAVIERVYERVMREKAPDVLWDEWDDYSRAKGKYSEDLLALERRRQRAIRNGSTVEPLEVWQSVRPNPLSRLAQHLLVIVPNSAANERVFSAWGDIHTKKRNRLHFDQINNLSRVRTAAHKAHTPVTSRKKRNDGTALLPDAAAFVSLTPAARLATEISAAAYEPYDILSNELDLECTAREWWRELDAEKERERGGNVPVAALGNLTLAEVFAAESGLHAVAGVRAQSSGLWRVGEMAMELERMLFEAAGEEWAVAGEDDEDWMEIVEPSSKRVRVEDERSGDEEAGEGDDA